jgi:selenocysteine-specific elongation factor
MNAEGAAPLTLGTAGHIDHGKTALVRSLTGTDTDRLPQERSRGISIELGYAQLVLPNGRTLSVIDVPGHERFVRTMVAGATGIDLFLLVVAADDGVMPQTIEHAHVLRALGVTRGVVAVTKSDLADPDLALAEADELLAPWATVEAVACSARTGEGIDELARALERAAAALPSRAADVRPPLLHIDRSFTIRGAGTVVTGTLWSGTIAPGDRLSVLPRGLPVRVRSVEVHDEFVGRAAAGQRVALNLSGVKASAIARGDAIADQGDLEPTHILDAELDLSGAPGKGRVKVHHGTRSSTGRLIALGAGRWQLRVEQPLLARAGDHVVIRSIAPPDTLGGGVVIDPHPRRHSLQTLEREARERAETPATATATAAAPATPPAPAERPLSPAALALEQRLVAAGYEPPNDADLGEEGGELAALVAAGRAVRIGRTMHAHPEAIAIVRDRAIAIIEAEGELTLARLRDELHTSRKYAQALIEHLDAAHVTVRRPDDTRVLRRRRVERRAAR